MQMTRRILIVSDDQSFREQFGEQLILADDFDVFEAEDGESGIERALEEAPDLVGLALELPDMKGPEVCSRMRVAGIGCPIVIFGERATDNDAITCLDAGANDFISRPFSLRVVLARIRSHLRQHEESGEAALPLGPYSFLPGKRIVMDHARRRIRLTVKEARILRCLIGAEGQPVPRATLLGEIWDHGAFVKSHTLETHVYRLRRKIEPDPKRPAILLTDQGGYRIGSGYARRVSGSEQANGASGAAGAMTVPAPCRPAADARSSRRSVRARFHSVQDGVCRCR